MPEITTKSWQPKEIRALALDGCCFPAVTVGILPSRATAMAVGTILGQIAETGYYDAYDDAAVNGLEVAVGILAEPYDPTAGGLNEHAGQKFVPMYVGGHFHEDQLVGLDAPAKADMGARSIPGQNLLILPC